MRILLDIDVVLDFLLARQPFEEDARELWIACAQGRVAGYISPITPVNVFYFARKSKGVAGARQLVADMLRILKVCSLDHAAIQAAQALPMADFEDAVQAAAAAAAGLDALVTRNAKDYRAAPLTILTPAEALASLASAAPPPNQQS
jgi:predicted nucleic acid-binding protein